MGQTEGNAFGVVTQLEKASGLSMILCQQLHGFTRDILPNWLQGKVCHNGHRWGAHLHLRPLSLQNGYIPSQWSMPIQHRPMVTFEAHGASMALGRYQIILLGHRGNVKSRPTSWL